MIHNYYQQGGGEHTVFENERKLLQENGIEVFSFTRDNADLKRKPWKVLFLPFSTIWSFSSYRAVKRLIREKHIDLVHCHNTFPQISPSVYYAAWHCGVPVVQTIHNFRLVCPNGLCFREGHICEECLHHGLKNALHYGCYRNSRVQTLPVVLMLTIHRKLGTYKRLPCIFLSQLYRETIGNALGIRQTFQKGNFIWGMPMNADKPSTNDFVYVGRLDDYKGILFLLKRFADMPENTLHVFGSGEKEKELRACSTANVIFHGFCSKETMAEVWPQSCALLWPSECIESFGMNVVESYQMGVPVVCSNIANATKIVSDGKTGTQYPIGDEKAFAEALRKVQENREQMGQNALAAAAEYSPEKNFHKLMDIYEEIGRYDSAKS